MKHEIYQFQKNRILNRTSSSIRPDEFNKMLEEYNKVNCEYLIQPVLYEESGNTGILSYEKDFIVPYKKITEYKRLTDKDFISLCISAVEAVGALYECRFAACTIHPSSLYCLPDYTVRLLLPGFIPVEDEREYLFYSAPEVSTQTDFDNVESVSRMIFYSLGLILYEVFTGEKLCSSNEVLETFHRKMTDRKLISSGKKSVLNIFDKMTALNPQERYHCASEIIHDLKYCLKKCSSSESEEAALEFHEERDFSFSVFRISREIEGREKETALLEKSFRDTANGKSRIVFVSGYSGIGKTSLVSNFLEIIHSASGFILKGKFDQYNNSPYTGFVQIFSTLFGKLLQFDEDKLSLYRDRIIKLLGRNGKLLTDIVPVLEKITGCYSEPEVTGAVEVNNYITYMFHKLLSLFASSEKPIVIFLDDLQWCDRASYYLLNYILNLFHLYDNIFIIAAYRDNELNDELKTIVKSAVKRKENYLSISLDSLSADHTGEIINKTFNINNAFLKKIVYEKTDGNPFFINQFLLNCVREKSIYFNENTQSWDYDINVIDKVPPAADICLVSLEAGLKNNSEMIQLLKIISCNGGSSFEKEIYELSGLSMERYEKALYLALDAGYLKFTGSDNEKISFSHDRIYQASYSLIPDSKKYIYHKNTAEYLIRSLSDKETENRIFDITDQLIRSYKLKPDNEIVSDSQVLFLAEYCFRAGDRALSIAAWQSSLKYFKTALEVFSDTEWINHYDFSLKLYTRGAESALLNQEYELMGKLISRVKEKAHDILDIIPALKIRGMSYMARARLPDAVDLGKQILLLLGIKIPEKHIKLHTFIESLKVRFYLKYGNRNDPETDRKTAVLLDSLIFTFSPAYLAAPELFPVIVLKQIPLYGMNKTHPLYPFSMILYSLYLIASGNIDIAYKYGKEAHDLVVNNNHTYLIPKINFLFSLFVKHWKDPLSESMMLFREGYKNGISSGDFEYVTYCMSAETMNYIFSGDYLPEAFKQMSDNYRAVKNMGQQRNMETMNINNLVVSNLLAITGDWKSLSTDTFNEDSNLESRKAINETSYIGIYYLYKMILSVCYGNYSDGAEYLDKAKEYIKATVGQTSIQAYCFYSAIINSENYRLNNQRSRKQLEGILFSIKNLSQWAKHSPENQLHRLYHVKAEYYSIKKKYDKASMYFKLAIKTAGRNGYINEKALALERFAEFYFSRKMENEGVGYVVESFNAYKKWGAKRKLILMKEQYPEILSSYNTLLPHEEKERITVFTDFIDRDALAKATGTILSEIKQSSLFEKLLTILLQYAGAESGYLYVTVNGIDRFAASAETVSGKISVRTVSCFGSEKISKENSFYKSIVNYTGRTHEIFNLPSDNPEINPGLFSDYKDISVLCIPIIRQSKKQGIILLVNTINRSGFSKKTEQMIKVIASQASIALENARLYSELEKQINIQNDLKKEGRVQIQKLMDSDKFASIGFLLEELAHEISNPNQAVLLRSSYLEDACENMMKLADEYYEEEGDFDVGIEMYSEFRKNFPEALAAITSSSRQINAIIKNLKSYIKNENIHEINHVDLNEVVEETVRLSSFFIRKKTSRFYFNRGNVPPVVGNFQRLQQVMLNLIQNSCLSLSSQDKCINIKTEFDCQRKYAVITVNDEGEGISEEEVLRAKERFFTTRGNRGGTGLGLSVSDSIIKEHGGELIISSVPGEGTEVKVCLPVEK